MVFDAVHKVVICQDPPGHLRRVLGRSGLSPGRGEDDAEQQRQTKLFLVLGYKQSSAKAARIKIRAPLTFRAAKTTRKSRTEYQAEAACHQKRIRLRWVCMMSRGRSESNKSYGELLPGERERG